MGAPGDYAASERDDNWHTPGRREQSSEVEITEY
jgi:hypothetical protein